MCLGLGNGTCESKVILEWGSTLGSLEQALLEGLGFHV